MKLLRHSTQVIYSAAIAHQLAAQQSQSAVVVARELATTWAENPSVYLSSLPLPPAAYCQLKIQATAAGLIRIELSDRAIALWLNHLTIEPDAAPDNPMTQRLKSLASVTGISASQHTGFSQSQANLLTAEAMFPIQHAYARCADLLQLGQQAGWIGLNQPAMTPWRWQWLQPAQIPWLNPVDCLVLDHAVDRALICQLYAAWDGLVGRSSDTANSTMKLAVVVSQAFQAFHRQHQLFNPTILEATKHNQLGLIFATLRILSLLLTRLQLPILGQL
jgi:hypothetical protein